MLAFRRTVGTSRTFYELHFRFYFIVILRSKTLVTFQNEHILLPRLPQFPRASFCLICWTKNVTNLVASTHYEATRHAICLSYCNLLSPEPTYYYEHSVLKDTKFVFFPLKRKTKFRAHKNQNLSIVLNILSFLYVEVKKQSHSTPIEAKGGEDV
jgi:hypothetical protein